MVRTRSDYTGVRVSAKAPRKMPTASTSTTPGKSSKKYEGGNSVCPRETPTWQKEITRFFPVKQNSDESGSTSNNSSEAGNSSAQANDD